MKLEILGNIRRDRKYKVRLTFPGAPNAFGGHYPASHYTKLYTTEQLLEALSRPTVELVGFVPLELRNQ